MIMHDVSNGDALVSYN